MRISKTLLTAALTASAVSLGGTSASAADWQALKGVAAAPMQAAEMDAVQGKALPLNYMSLLLSGQQVSGFSMKSVSVGGATFMYSIGTGDSATIAYNGSLFKTP